MTTGVDGELLDAALKVVRTVAAAAAGHVDGDRDLLASFEELALGALLRAELALCLLSREGGEPLAVSVGDLSLSLLQMRG